MLAHFKSAEIPCEARNRLVNAVKLLLKNHQIIPALKWNWMRNIFLKFLMKTWGILKDVSDISELFPVNDFKSKDSLASEFFHRLFFYKKMA